MSDLSALRSETYINLQTFRRNGQGVPTPVWFVEEGGVLYVRTLARSGKVKRVRNNPRVRVAACDARGNLKGEWVEAQAWLVGETEAAHANELLNRKYGLMKRAFDLIGWVRKDSYAVIKITPILNSQSVQQT
ncbi:MAG: PPOX class F420-dependent oxidoreductase [Anaerolineae bacterium]|nr:PPOX class F420-dependent oxidoreductase [Thermoflexales bacterium]MDW8053461.1 PPOX class F420-dependent oxidoreductase [Anaerolineae bacterium]MDW8293221.1 PPOX class F420-dependent oxidoreductase [Anaerolineae bacterium]